jgi:hypothetical protein
MQLWPDDDGFTDFAYYDLSGSMFILFTVYNTDQIDRRSWATNVSASFIKFFLCSDGTKSEVLQCNFWLTLETDRAYFFFYFFSSSGRQREVGLSIFLADSSKSADAAERNLQLRRPQFLRLGASNAEREHAVYVDGSSGGRRQRRQLC